MLCPVCGRSDGLCDCLVATAPGQANDGADVAGPAGAWASPPHRKTGPTPSCSSCGTSPLRHHMCPAGHTSAVRSQRPCGARISRARPWPSGRDGHCRSQSLTGRAKSSRRDASAPRRPVLLTPSRRRHRHEGSPSTGSAPAPPLRIAPFVTAPATEERAQDRSSASSGSAARPGTTNTAWSGGEFEWHPAEVPGRSQ